MGMGWGWGRYMVRVKYKVIQRLLIANGQPNVNKQLHALLRNFSPLGPVVRNPISITNENHYTFAVAKPLVSQKHIKVKNIS